MLADAKDDFHLKVYNAIYLCLTDEVLREVVVEDSGWFVAQIREPTYDEISHYLKQSIYTIQKKAGIIKINLMCLIKLFWM